MDPPVDRFFRRLARAPRSVLALDYDGTLAPVRARPAEAWPYPGVLETLRRLIAGGRTRLVILSGRPAVEVRALLGLPRAPEIWGAHGWERLLPGRGVESPDPSDDVRAVLAAARPELERHHLAARAEWKTASVAVHWRDAPDPVAAAAAARSALAPLAARPGFELLPIAAGLELRCRRRHKGTALAAVLAEESDEVPVAYLGDDATDEDAFAALAGRGLGLRVALDRSPTAAAATLAPGCGVLRFLRRWLRITSAGDAVVPRPGEPR